MRATVVACAGVAWLLVFSVVAASVPVSAPEAAEWAAGARGMPPPVPYVRPKPEWDRFLILVWQYKTDVAQDLDRYRRAGFAGFHIDRGAGRKGRVDFARREGLPYYNDHAADKGYLHLTERTGVRSVQGKRTLIPRPWSLADPKTLQVMKDHLRRNVSVTRAGPVVGYAFDDEISLGCFNSPAEVDASPASVAAYRKWLAREYGTVDRLNAEWGTTYGTFADAGPVSFEDVRSRHTAPPFARWNLARWMDWRSFMDTQFADCLAELVRFTNGLDPTTPAGFVGGQQPSPYGGYDYAKLCKVVQWIESYDIGGTNEILRSLWRWPERRPHVQTWFSRGEAKADAWFLWYYLVHGNRGVIAWPERKGNSWFHWDGKGLAPFIEAGADTFREVQGDVSRPILDPDARFDADPIAVFESQPSVQASWAMDVVPHRGTWPNRSSSLDNACQTYAHNRVAWFKLLEDCGYQYTVVTGEQVAAGMLEREKFRVLILRRAICLSDAEADAIRRFVRAGGTVIADHLAGMLDEHGKGRPKGALDTLFGLVRDESQGYLDGKTIAEINGEKYKQPFLQRLSYSGALRHRGIVVYERGTHAESGSVAATQGAETPAGRAAARVGTADVVVTCEAGKGRAVYLNLTPVAYNDLGQRRGAFGQAWRAIVSALLEGAGLVPRARVFAGGQPVPMAETLFWTRGDRTVLCLIKNPPRQAAVDSAGELGGVFGDPADIEIRLARPARTVRNLRSAEELPAGDVLRVRWKPWEALVFEMTF